MERLQKVLAQAGIASRRGAEEIIKAGEVTVNGKVAELGTKADPEVDHIKVRGKLITPGSMLFHPDPHFEGEFRTETGGEILIVQYPGPTTRELPIYAGRFNMAERKPVAQERVDL